MFATRTDGPQVITTGEVPGLFNREDYSAVIAEVRALALKEPDYVESSDWLQQFFYSRVQDRLHLVLCLSPAGEPR